MTAALLTSTADVARLASARTMLRVDIDGDIDGDIFARLASRLATMEDYKEAPRTTRRSLGILTADDIPSDASTAINIRDWRPEPKPFTHVPTISVTRGNDTTVIAGPIEPVLPRMTEATRAGWERWFEDLAAHNAMSAAAAAAANREVKEYFEKRADRQHADREAKYKRACDRAFKQGKPIPPRPVRKPPPDNWTMFIKDEKLRAMMRASSDMGGNARRLRRYVHKRGPVAGRDTAEFVEEFRRADGTVVKALRTALGTISLDLFNSALPMRSSMVWGLDKTKVYYEGLGNPDAMTLRDKPYVESDRTRRCLFIVDLDGWWPSIKALRRALRKLLPPEFMPNIIVFRAHPEKGGIENPHLLWLLPPGARVHLFVRKGKKKLDTKIIIKQRNLHAMIQKGIVSHLIPLGADPDHHNVWKCKNPLSPNWSIDVCDDSFATMDEWRAFLSTITPDPREMKRRAKLVKAARLGGDPDDVEFSSAVFNDGVTSRRLMIRAAKATKDPDFLKATATSHAAFVGWLYHPVDGVVTRRLIKQHGDTTVVRSVLRAQREFVEELKLTPSQCSQFSDRGRDYFINRYKKQELGPNASAEEREDQETARKAAAGRRSRAAAKDVSCGLIAEEIERRIEAGIEVVKAEVVKALVKSGTVSRSVAYDHFDKVHKVVRQAARYQAVLSELQVSSSRDQVKISPSADQVTESGEEKLIPGLAAGAVDWVAITEAELNQLRCAHEIRESWRKAVSAWRKTHQPVRSGCDLADLDEDDPIIRAAALVDGSAWSRRCRILH